MIQGRWKEERHRGTDYNTSKVNTNPRWKIKDFEVVCWNAFQRQEGKETIHKLLTRAEQTTNLYWH